VFWAGVEAEKLDLLQKDVEDRMSELGFAKENRPFTPHLTWRASGIPAVCCAGLRSREMEGPLVPRICADRFSLFESILHRTGAEYHVVQTFELAVK